MKALITPLLLVVVLAGCAGKDNVEPPSPLTKIENSIDVDRVWSTDTGAGLGENYLSLSPYTTSGDVYVADHKGNVRAFELSNGKRKWSVDIDKSISAGVNGGGDLLVVGTDEGELVALDAASGNSRWMQQLSSRVSAISPISSGVVVARTGDGYVYGVEAASGLIRWQQNFPVPALSLRNQSEPIVGGGAVLAGLDNGSVVAMTLKEGKIGWEKTIAAGRGRSELERMVDIDGQMALAGTELFLVGYQGKAVAIHVPSGKQVWAQDASSYTGLTVDRDLVFYTDEDSVVWGLDRRSGSSVWRQDLLKFRRLTTPTTFDNYVIVADLEGYMHWMERDSGRILARTRADSDGVLAPPKAVGAQLLVLGNSGKLSSWQITASR